MSRKCGNCIHSRQERPYGEWVCGNEESEAYGLDIAYDDVCEEWEYRMSRILPILFNTEMTKAILDGRKTVTRRVVKRKGYTDRIHDAKNDYACKVANNLYQIGYRLPTRMYPQESVGVRPQYQVGDILYVRETEMIQSMKAVGNKVKMLFAADDALVEFSVSDEEYERLLKWANLQRFLSPYWLTKETARTWIEVTDVRVERLQDITEEQARAEGFTDKTHFIDTFLKLYPECSLETWLWVYEFERCEKPK